MKNSQALVKPVLLAATCLSFLLLQNCHDKKPDTTETAPEQTVFAGAFQAPHVRSFPSPKDTINQWIAGLNEPKIRAHAWDIWESITSTIITKGGKDTLPLWETWFSGYEVFTAANSLELRDVVKDFQNPSQFFHGSNVTAIPIAPAERPLSFNKFSPSLAKVIYNYQYNKAAILDTINCVFTRNKTATVDRQIQTSTAADTVDQFSFALKPVFQFINGSQPTALPFWAGVSVQTTNNLTNPSPDTWRQCVVVDPTGKLTPGSTVVMSCNGQSPKPWPVVSLKDFYSIKITQAMADSFSVFAAQSGDDIGTGNHSDSTSVVDMVKAGNIALLMAMHVTGKEITNWTWQTFWWSPETNDPVFGADRPASIQRPWNNYNMRTAYYMTAPGTVAQPGEPNIQFNPYLETNLFGTLTSQVGSKDTIHWYGVFSNCMSCHRMAAWPNNDYIPDGYINAADSVQFSGKTKTDFLWSIPTRAN